MARQENPREDLLAEATALVERAELRIAGFAEPIVVGFRRNGAASIYFGQDAAYHFNTANELRRAFIGGTLYKADRGRLAALVRRRTAAEVELVRHDLDETVAARLPRHASPAANRISCGARRGSSRSIAAGAGRREFHSPHRRLARFAATSNSHRPFAAGELGS